MTKLAHPAEAAAFWSRITGGHKSKCWPWRGTTNGNGYGRWRHQSAHRIAYEWLRGPIPYGMMIRHRCDNPPCCNPWHLDIGTAADNAADAMERGRTCRGAKNGRARLTPDQVAYIRRNPDDLTGRQLAARFGYSQAGIHYIRSGRSWRGVVADEGIEPTSSACEAPALPLS
jgi:HNH endonuclease